jgi:hypothetical protein
LILPPDKTLFGISHCSAEQNQLIFRRGILVPAAWTQIQAGKIKMGEKSSEN